MFILYPLCSFSLSYQPLICLLEQVSAAWRGGLRAGIFCAPIAHTMNCRIRDQIRARLTHCRRYLNKQTRPPFQPLPPTQCEWPEYFGHRDQKHAPSLDLQKTSESRPLVYWRTFRNRRAKTLPILIRAPTKTLPSLHNQE